LLQQLDSHAEELALIDADLGRAALARPEVLRLMTIPGVDTTVAVSIVAAVGDFTRFRTPDKLVSSEGARPAARLLPLPAGASPPRHADRRGGHRPQAHGVSLPSWVRVFPGERFGRLSFEGLMETASLGMALEA
jgi:transposase